MRIDFDNKNHAYYVDGEIATISVTELLSKHGIADDFSAVPTKTLKRKAEVGKLVHKDIENVVFGTEPKTFEGSQFQNWTFKNCFGCIPETLLAIKAYGITIAGTCDLIGIGTDEKLFIADHKTVTKLNKDYVSWQVSIYDYMARKMGKIKNLDEEYAYTGAERFYCFHYAQKQMKVVELEKVPDAEIERLFEAEAKGEQYKPRELVVAEEFRLKVEQAESALLAIESERDIALANAKKLREELLTAMKEQGIRRWETDKIKVSFIRGTERKTIDSEKLKRIFPRAYEKCLKTTLVNDSIRITPKGAQNGNE